jgi:hypothetical protein
MILNVIMKYMQRKINKIYDFDAITIPNAAQKKET